MVLLVVVIALLVGAVAVFAAESIMAHRPLGWPACPHCQTPYALPQWSALLALLSGRRRCRACGHPVRWQRLVGELALACLWGVLAARYGLEGRALLAMLAGIPLAMVLVTDLETRLIPNRIILPAIVIMFPFSALVGPAVPSWRGALWWHGPLGGLIGFVVFWVLVFLGTLAFGEGALGGGDIKLAAFIGLTVGYPLIIEALVLTFIFGFLGALALLALRRGSLRSYFPYGPFLVLGAMVTMLWGVEIVQWYFR